MQFKVVFDAMDKHHDGKPNLFHNLAFFKYVTMRERDEVEIRK
jgi:hypothetical protein